jgi:hypothetical protein
MHPQSSRGTEHGGPTLSGSRKRHLSPVAVPVAPSNLPGSKLGPLSAGSKPKKPKTVNCCCCITGQNDASTSSIFLLFFFLLDNSLHVSAKYQAILRVSCLCLIPKHISLKRKYHMNNICYIPPCSSDITFKVAKLHESLLSFY